jgi:hypothetical protein
VEVTAAVGRCGTCGRTIPMAEVWVFDHAPGGAWLDLRGLTYLQLLVPEET